MKVALYSRVSTKDHGQDTELQLVPMRRYAELQSLQEPWDVVEYSDVAAAGDFAGRKDWKRLLDDCRRGLVDRILVWKLDRAFRSSVHALTTLEEMEKLGVGFTCVTQPIDTTTPTGKLVLAILAAVAEFEKLLIRERTIEGLKNARRKGKTLGRPSVASRPGFAKEWKAVLGEVEAGRLSQRAGALRLGIGVATFTRLRSDSKSQGPASVLAKGA